MLLIYTKNISLLQIDLTEYLKRLSFFKSLF